MAVADGADVVCTITNTRKPGKLEVRKSLAPASTHGRLRPSDRRPDRGTGAGVGDGGTTGEQTVSAGIARCRRDRRGRRGAERLHALGRSAATPTARAAIVATLRAAPLSVDVPSSSDIVCVITNTRKTGKLEVVKDLIPAADPGDFNLQIDGQHRRTARTSATAARRASGR